MSVGRVPGTWQTQIVVWEVDDPSKLEQPQFWWTAREVGQLMRTASPEDAGRLAVAGTPKGRSLADLRAEFGGDEVEVRVGRFPAGSLGTPSPEHAALLEARPAYAARFSLRHWADADRRRTRLLISNSYTPTEGQREAYKALFPEPPEIEELREAWFAALKAGDPSAAELREQLDAELIPRGHVCVPGLWIWNPNTAVEIGPTVFVRDERPPR